MNNIILWHKCHIKLTFLEVTLRMIFFVLTWSQILSCRPQNNDRNVTEKITEVYKMVTSDFQQTKLMNKEQ